MAGRTRLVHRPLTIGAWLSCLAIGLACGGQSAENARDAPALPGEDRAAATATARTFGELLFGPLMRAEATAADLRKLRTVTAEEVYAELLAKHRNAARKRRESEHARSKLDERPSCHVGEVRVSPRSLDRVLAEPAIACGGREPVVIVGWEIVRRDGRWVVHDLRDARFDRDGRCIAVSCR